MKTILLVTMTLITLASTSSFAGYTDEQLRTMRKCSIDECRGSDGGYGYKVQCEHPIFNKTGYEIGISVLLKRPQNGTLCYCPCNLGFWGEMSR